MHDLHLSLSNSVGGGTTDVPMHQDIVDSLISWAKPRNFDLNPLFELMSFNALGNIPDVSTLAGDNLHVGYTPPMLQDLLDEMIKVVDNFLPSTNNSSYQILTVGTGVNKRELSARILALTFAGLVLCEEANRGDRWFSRTILKDETKTTMLGGAMPIAYFAARTFNWGVEFGKASRNLVPSS
ncbi:hypothetical protein EGI32_05660 [Ferruginibacter sp. HRS2-29]|nr:hypothetical protein [Ferruginibacter sp. HRS2-29]